MDVQHGVLCYARITCWQASTIFEFDRIINILTNEQHQHQRSTNSTLNATNGNLYLLSFDRWMHERIGSKLIFRMEDIFSDWCVCCVSECPIAGCRRNGIIMTHNANHLKGRSDDEYSESGRVFMSQWTLGRRERDQKNTVSLCYTLGLNSFCVFEDFSMASLCLLNICFWK